MSDAIGMIETRYPDGKIVGFGTGAGEHNIAQRVVVGIDKVLGVVDDVTL